jgi:tripartite-type tricarboxylate transporter receptor subunit TctC
MTMKVSLAAGFALLLSCATVGASDYPSKPISIVVPFPAGSTSDLIPRLVAPLVSKTLGVPVVVENRPGANGSLGAVRVAQASADGYTLLLATTGVLAINQWIYAKPQYDPAKDFTPITNAASTPNMIVVNRSVPASNLTELIALAKAQPGSLSFASAGNGSTSHICGEALKILAGADIVHVPYQGPAPALQDLLGSRVSMICDNLSNVVQYVRDGQLKPIVVTATVASPQLPDVPTSQQAGVPELEAGIWYGFVAPAATPPAVIQKLNAAFVEALRDETVQSRLKNLGMTIIGDSPEAFQAFISSESARMEKVVKASRASIP